MSRKTTTPSEENYLEWIYRFSQEGPVRPSDLAEKLGVKRPSVTKAMQVLREKGLVNHKARGTIMLTEEGMSLAQAVVRRDKCLTALLVNVLDLSPESADAEVHRLEHVLDDAVLERLETLVSFAVSSPAWLKRLHLRIRQLPQPAHRTDDRYLVGHTPIHPGIAREKGHETEGDPNISQD